MQVLAASDVRVVGLSGESCLALPRVNAGLGKFWTNVSCCSEMTG